MLRVQQYRPPDQAEVGPSGTKRKRQREITSCRPCRSQKIACNREQPCKNCAMRKREAACTYDWDGDRGSVQPSPQTPVSAIASAQQTVGRRVQETAKSSGVEQRLARIEDQLERLNATIGPIITGCPVQSRALAASPQAQHDSALKETSNPYAAAAILNSTKAAGTTIYWGSHHWKKPIAEDMAYLSTASHNSARWTSEPPSLTLSRQFSDLQRLSGNFSADRRSTIWDVAVVRPKISQPSVEDEVLACLPSRSICECMVARFMANMNQIYPILDHESLDARAQDYWTSSVAKPSDQWLVLYLAVIALGCQLPPIQHEVTPPNTPTRRHGKDLFDVARAHIVGLAQQARSPTVMGSQCVLLIVIQEKLNLDWTDGDDLTSGLLALLSRMAFVLGLHRDPDAFNLAEHERERDMRRKVYWSIALLDFEHSLHCGSPSVFPHYSSDVESVHPEDTLHAYLANVAQILQIGSQTLSVFHSKKADASEAEVHRLSQELARIFDQLVATGSSTTESITQSSNIDPLRQLQRCFSICLVGQLQILLYWPLIQTEECYQTKATISGLVTTILDSAIRLIDTVRTTSSQSQHIWAHLLAALLRCSLYYTCSIAMVMIGQDLRQSQNDARKYTESAALEAKVKVVLDFLESIVASSFEGLKQSVFSQMQLRTVHERSRLPDRGVLDAESDEWKLLLVATQQAMDLGIHRAKIAIESARKSDNPPPNLLPAAPATTMQPGETRQHHGAVINGEGDSELLLTPDLMGTMDTDWSLMFDEWISNTETAAC